MEAAPPKKRMSEEQKNRLRGVASIVAFIVFLAVAAFLIGKPLMQFFGDPQAFRTWVDGHGVWGRLAFVGMMFVQIVIAFIPGEPLEIAAGYAFGIWEGMGLCLLGAVCGSAIVFLFVRKFGTKVVEAFFPLEKIREVKFLRDPKRLNLLVFVLFFIPGTPKDLMTYCVGLTEMKLSTFLLLTTVARIPPVITSTIGGNALGSEKYLFAVIVFAATLALSGAGLLVYRKISGSKAEKAADTVAALTEPLPAAEEPMDAALSEEGDPASPGVDVPAEAADAEQSRKIAG